MTPQDQDKFLDIPLAKDMREVSEKNKDYYIKDEIRQIVLAINLASNKGQVHIYLIQISSEAQEILKQKGYKVDFDMTSNMPSYKISW